MKQRQADISELLKKSCNLKQFGLLVNFDNLIDDLQGETITDGTLNNLNEKAAKILLSLDQLRNYLEIIDKIGRDNVYEYKWLFKGKSDITEIFSLVDLLEHNVDLLLNTLDRFSQQKIVSILDRLNDICNSLLSIKKVSYPIKTCLSILNHYTEIENEVLASIDSEIMFCIEQLEQMIEKKNQLKIEDQISHCTVKDFKKKINELNMISSRKYNGFMIFSTIDGQVFELYTKLHQSVSHISESLNLIPIALEDFYNTAKTYYKALVLETITNYENIVSKFSEYRKGLKTFKSEYVTRRNNLICEKIFKLVDINDESTSIELLQDIINILRPIGNYYGLSEQHLIEIEHIESIINRTKQQENIIQTPLPKNKSNSKLKRSFSNPLGVSLMKPILNNNFKEEDNKIKIFETPKCVDEIIFSKDNIDIVERIKLDVRFSNTKESLIQNTPSSEDSFASSGSSPDTMRVKNIFDSPDPFITPNSRNFHRSRLAISTPSTTPRITPTKKYVMLPIDEEPNTRNTNKLIGRDIPKPLLQFELSTVVNMESISDTENDYDNDISNASSEFIDSPPNKIIPTTIQNNNSPNSPQISRSRIPLPVRPESRLSMLRSVSRLENPQPNFEKNTPIRRPDSRLENLATNISSRLGTNSPVFSTTNTLKARPVTVMTQRTMDSTENIMLGRLQEKPISNIKNVRARGVTSLGSRTSFTKPRIASI